MELQTILGTHTAHHHAVALAGDRDQCTDSVCSFIESVHHMDRRTNPDFFLLETDSLSVGDARTLREKASLQGIAGGTRVFVIIFNSATPEAQNALLKLLEEPPRGAYFFIIVPASDSLLPTVQSRLFLITNHEKHRGRESSIDVELFLKKSPGARLKMLEPLMKRASDEKTKPAALTEARLFVREVTRNLSRSAKKVGKPRGLAEVARAGSYLHDRSPSIKMLLEYLAISL